MKTKIFISLFIVYLFSGFQNNVFAADNAIHAGVLVNPIGSGLNIGYERMILPGVSIGGRFNTIGYDYWDGDYNEWGKGSGIELTVNYHLNNKGFDGPFIGAAIGQANVDWNWYDYYSTPRSGYGKSKLTSFLGTFGWDINVGNFVIRPSLILGSYSGTSNDNTGTKKSKIGAIAGAGIAAVLIF